MAALAQRSFEPLFWNTAAGCLFDVVDRDNRDGSIRPNQIFAVSLPYSMLSADKAGRVVDVVERDLLTPYGLRTLAPKDPNYCGRYQGDPSSRDRAYHQGTVWPWLLGPFITAYRRVNGWKRDNWLVAFRAHLFEAGLGQMSEVFDGDPPHRPGGCIAQAWSVAEILRVMVQQKL
jgi:glycogen debranching enzyme